MKYRRIDKLDWHVSVLGLDVSRLPVVDQDPVNINDVELVKIIRYAVDHGVNYLDLGHFYNLREFERLPRRISQALHDGYRRKIKIAANLSPYLIHSVNDFDRQLKEQLRGLQLDKIDVCILGGLNRNIWPKLKELNVLGWAESAMRGGLIDSLGFSFHDDHHVLKSILNDYDNWSMCRLPFSYSDHLNHHPGIIGLKLAAAKGLGVIISEPLREERSIGELPEAIAGVWGKAPYQSTETEWGLRWIWNHPEVSTVICDLSTMEQVVQCAALADSSEPDKFSVPELLQLNQVRDAYRKLRPFPCPSCHCCMPCPTGVQVPRIFELYNDAVIYNGVKKAQFNYAHEQLGLDNCTECGACANACPREFPIMDWLKTANRLLTGP